MLSWFFNRLFYSIVTIIGVLTLTFIVMRVIPGNPVLIYLGDMATPEAVEQMTARLGLDQPLYIQYKDFLLNLFLHGDFGTSIHLGRPVLNEILYHLPYTIHLMIASFIVSISIGIPVGMIAAFYKESAFDHIMRPLSLIGLAIPSFWLGLMLILLFSLRLEWFPVLGAGTAGNPASIIYHIILPSLTIGVTMGAMNMRVARSCLLEVMNTQYITMAYAKGLKKVYFLCNYLLKNALIPVVTIVGLQLGRLISISVIVEIVFNRPGLGKLLVDSIFLRDYPMALGVIVFSSVFIVFINVIVDIIYFVVDPRIRVD